jgi:predicted anti-sigma-YlaC factor YlaD
VLQRAGVPDPGTKQWIRYVLGVVAASLVALNLPRLVATGAAAELHDERHLGAFGVALGAGLLWAAIRPERAIGLVPMAAALAAATGLGAGVDLIARRTTAVGESHHLLEVTGLVLLWALSGGRRRLARRLDGWQTVDQLRDRLGGHGLRSV